MLNKIIKKTHGKAALNPRDVLSDPLLCLAFGFGSGLSRYMPGTIGTLAAIPIYFLLIQTPLWLYIALTLLAVVTGIWICQNAADKLKEHDYGGIVWDEVAGYLITMSLVPYSLKNLLIGFILFRILDILKPWPIKWADKHVSGGFGIMLDDVMAGIFAAIALWVLQ